EPLPVRNRVRRRVSDRESLQRRLCPEPRLELLEDLERLRATELGYALEIAGAALVDFVERADPIESEIRFGVIRHRLFEFSIDVRPASGEHDTVAIFFAKAGAVRLRCVAHGDTAIALHQRTKCFGALVVANSMHDDLRRGDAPDLPRLV